MNNLQFSRYWAINCREFYNQWCLSKNVDFIEKCWFHRKKLISNNIDIWPSNNLIRHFHIRAYVILPLLSQFKRLRQIGLRFVMGAKETIIYQLVVRNPGNDAYFTFSIFGPLSTFGGKMSVATTCTVIVWCFQTLPKSWPFQEKLFDCYVKSI